MSAVLERPRELLEVSGRNVTFNPHEDQLLLWESDARYLGLIAGTGGGKTSFGVPWLMRDVLAAGPDGRGLATSPTYQMLNRSLLPYMQWLWVRSLKIAEFHKADMYFEFRDGQQVRLATADNPNSMEGQHVHAVLLDEGGLMQRLAWEVAQRRVGFHEGRVLVTSTPYFLNWLQEMVRRYKAGDPLYYVRQFASIKNPSYPRAEFERARRELSHAEFAMKYLGQFERPAGLIYP
ncbi:MAG: hypothetical protein M3P51_09035, partial [Chloroflexota bacterium]|nr:hypothetical protein [Chloroflexota bacterium]